jgi:hypothetical protein
MQIHPSGWRRHLHVESKTPAAALHGHADSRSRSKRARAHESRREREWACIHSMMSHTRMIKCCHEVLTCSIFRATPHMTRTRIYVTSKEQACARMRIFRTQERHGGREHIMSTGKSRQLHSLRTVHYRGMFIYLKLATRRVSFLHDHRQRTRARSILLLAIAAPAVLPITVLIGQRFATHSSASKAEFFTRARLRESVERSRENHCLQSLIS